MGIAGISHARISLLLYRQLDTMLILFLLVMEQEVKKIYSFVILNGVVCPIYSPITEDDREEWAND